MTTRPADYIDLSKLQPPPKPTLRDGVANVARRFYDQEFTGKELAYVMSGMPRWSHYPPSALYSTIRHALCQLAEDGQLEIVSKGGPGRPNIYRNKEHIDADINEES